MFRVQSQQAVLCNDNDPYGAASSPDSLASSVDRYYASQPAKSIETRHRRTELSLAHWCHEIHIAQERTYWWCTGCTPVFDPLATPAVPQFEAPEHIQAPAIPERSSRRPFLDRASASLNKMLAQQKDETRSAQNSYEPWRYRETQRPSVSRGSSLWSNLSSRGSS